MTDLLAGSQPISRPRQEDQPKSDFTLDMMVRSIADGVTFGYADEFAAKMDEITGRGGPYSENVAKERAIDDQMRRDHSGKTLIGNIVGGVMSPVTRAIGAVANPSKWSANLGTFGKYSAFGTQGAATGGLYGSGSAADGERLEGATEGAAYGAGFGIVLPALVSLGKSAIVDPAVIPAWQKFTRSLPVQQAKLAYQEIVKALQRDGMGPDDIRAALANLGDEATIADAGGKNVEMLADAVVNLPGKAAQAGRKALEQRQATRGTRVQNSIKRNMSDKGFYDELDRLDALRSKSASPLYKEAFDSYPEVKRDLLGKWASQIGEKGSRLGRWITEGFNEGLAKARSDADITGDLFDPQATFGAVADGEGFKIMGRTMSLRQWDAIKRGWDRLLETPKYGTRNAVTGELELTPEGRDLDGFRRKLLSELDAATGGKEGAYSKARAAWAGPSAIKDAMAAGRKYARGDEELVLKRFQSLSPDERDAYRVGAAREMLASVRKGGVVPSNMKNVLKDTDIRARLRAIFPDQDSFDNFIKTISSESRMNTVENRLLGGSPTAPRQAAADDLGVDIAGSFAEAVSGQPGSGSLVNLSRGILGWLQNPTVRIPEPMRDEIGSILLSKDRAAQEAFLSQLNTQARQQRLPEVSMADLQEMFSRIGGVGAGAY